MRSSMTGLFEGISWKELQQVVATCLQVNTIFSETTPSKDRKGELNGKRLHGHCILV
jgi:hypothetical protein